MRYVSNNDITDPRLNLALEEYLLRHVQLDEPLLLFYINEPSVIIGRHQNTIEEIDPDYIKANNVHVIRRVSGGGAVYHDLGNLNFSFITNDQANLHNFAKFTEPVVTVLQNLGMPATLEGKSDIVVDGKKISGNAQYASKGRMFSHGTILFDTSIEHMLHALNPRQTKIESKAVQSVRSFVTNVHDYLPADYTILDLKQAILDRIFGAAGVSAYEVDAAGWEKVRQIATAKYETWDWNYGRSPTFNVRKDNQLPVGKIDLRINVVRGVIDDLKIYGTFFSHRDIIDLEKQLIGIRYERDALANALNKIDLTSFFGNIDQETFLELLY
ncbi:MAG: lipoate--protein ligase [Chloroflexota bacterium]